MVFIIETNLKQYQIGNKINKELPFKAISQNRCPLSHSRLSDPVCSQGVYSEAHMTNKYNGEGNYAFKYHLVNSKSITLKTEKRRETQTMQIWVCEEETGNYLFAFSFTPNCTTNWMFYSFPWSLIWNILFKCCFPSLLLLQYQEKDTISLENFSQLALFNSI